MTIEDRILDYARKYLELCEHTRMYNEPIKNSAYVYIAFDSKVPKEVIEDMFDESKKGQKAKDRICIKEEKI